MLIDRRITLVFTLFVALLGFAVMRATYLGTLRAGSLKTAAASQQTSQIDLPAKRGEITDRNGAELAVTEAASDVSATPYLVKDPKAASIAIADVLGTTPASVLDKLADRKKGFVYLARNLPQRKADLIAKLNLEGIDLAPTGRRVYPRGMLASQVLGTVGTDGDGLSGVEFGRNRLLHGENGERRLVRDAKGEPISLRDVVPAKPGADLRLTLDANIQARTEQVLQQVGETYTPKGATALVMDPRSGDILALANWPRVDANDPAGAPAFARKDRAVSDAYEPGSTFKAITVAGALEDGLVTPDTTFDLAPTIKVADREIGESHERGPETLTTSQILAQSSNVGAITIGLKLGSQRFDRYVRRFGFGQPTGVELPGEGTGIVPKVSQYSGSSMGNLPIGQGLAVTPIQMATAYAAIANGGVLRPARIVDAVDGERVPRTQGRRVISARTAQSLRSMLEGVLAAGGTATEAAIKGYVLAGKTGTANKPDPATGGYSDSKYVASFVGFAPAKHPRLLVAVMVDEPQGEIFGGVVAAPAFKKIASFALPYLKIPPG